MLEKRQAKRRRVCLHGSVTSGLTHAIIPVQVRNVSATGAQIRVADGALPGREIAFRVDRMGVVQEARWSGAPWSFTAFAFARRRRINRVV